MSNMKISMTSALLILTSLACLAIATQARTLASENRHKKFAMIVEYERSLSPPPPPNSAPPSKEITSNIRSYETKFPQPLTSNLPLPRSQLQTHPCVGGRAKQLSPPPPPAASISPTQSEVNIAPPCVAGNPCSSFITTAVDYAKTETSPPSSPMLSTPERQLPMSEAPCVTGKTKPLKAPPPPAPSKSPTQSENKGSPCAADNPGSSFVTTVGDYGKTKILPPPPPEPSKSPIQAEKYDSPRVAVNPCSSLMKLKSGYGKPILSPPPTPAPSTSPIQSEKSDSACVDGNSCSSWQFIEMVTDHEHYGRPSNPAPPTPELAPPQHNELTGLMSS